MKTWHFRFFDSARFANEEQWKEFKDARMIDFRELGFEPLFISHSKLIRSPGNLNFSITCTEEDRNLLVEMFCNQYFNFDYYPNAD